MVRDQRGLAGRALRHRDSRQRRDPRARLDRLARVDRRARAEPRLQRRGRVQAQILAEAQRTEATTKAIESAARKLFASRGLAATSVDDIAARAGVAKGAVYHHFASKEELFARVLDSIQAELAAAPVPPASRRIADPLDAIADAALRWLLAASEPERRRILLVDGPAVIGWQRWREIDARYFGAGARIGVAAVLGEGASVREIDAAAQLLLGAVMEAALVCATADDPRKTARQYAATLRRMLAGLAPRAKVPRTVGD